MDLRPHPTTLPLHQHHPHPRRKRSHLHRQPPPHQKLSPGDAVPPHRPRLRLSPPSFRQGLELLQRLTRFYF
ncbi:hypothetical protein Bca52824_019827 [Brassica carinata]|uniref:Uncharacterized protein n=1 Tax=Brassica carinata TaxID=52824 RepID=A0A8X8AYZ4_BRACI|nr:hypothetical protein Bca52824_019827 [Brassica carinata]